ncbi:MAG: GIY-YIG nuclease family protein [FCB group bacterium]|nr:GIY-YIG nuclease family protein [FCB group bacterium]MBL7029063.1 GIY-YIG nuclease family protein [Candidatus Neomarinimicrobiota bacterium]MBL7121484.1 GIY-YIG nuclease family protein [Candidatus Neomarinimicrobiota bacterium]
METDELFYVYLLTSIADPNRHYTGSSTDPFKRAKAHNRGKSKHTAKYALWKLETIIGFRDQSKARALTSF